MRLDRIDWAMLEHLQRDGRATTDRFRGGCDANWGGSKFRGYNDGGTRHRNERMCNLILGWRRAIGVPRHGQRPH